MKIKVLLKGQFTVAAVMNGNVCSAETFITEGETAYEASRDGLADLLDRVASSGLSNLSSKQTHEVDKQHKIYEFIKGKLRLFYFKGQGDTVVVCTTGVLKQSQRADKKAVAEAIKCQKAYQAAITDGSLELVETEE